MAAGSAQLQFTIAAILEQQGFSDAANQLRQLKQQTDSNKDSTDLWTQAVTKLKSALEIGAVVEFYRESIEAASKMEQTQLQLQTAVENTGVSWASQKANINSYLDGLEETSRFSKEELGQALRELVQRTQDVTVSQNLLQLAMGISVATGENLTEVSTKLGLAATGNARGMAQLSREFGITGEASKNAELLLGSLEKRFGTLAGTENTHVKVQAQLNNAFTSLKEDIGAGLIPVMNVLEIIATKSILVFKQLASALAGVGAVIVGALTLDMNLIKEGLKNLESAGDAINRIGAKGADEMKSTGALTTKAATEMSAELKKILKDLENETLKIQKKGGQDKFAEVEKEFQQEKAAIQANDAYKNATAKQQAQIDVALERDHAAKIAQAKTAENAAVQKLIDGFSKKDLQDLKKKGSAEEKEQDAIFKQELAELKQSQTYINATNDQQYAIEQAAVKDNEDKKAKIRAAAAKANLTAALGEFKTIGTATGEALSGQADSYKTAAASMVNSIANKAESNIIATTVENYLSAVNQSGGTYAAYAANAGILLIGAAEVAAVAAAASAASSAISGGTQANQSTNAAATTTAATTTGTTSASTTTAATAPTNQAAGLTVNIYGDHYGDPAFTALMAKNISAQVENNNLRLVSSQLVAQ